MAAAAGAELLRGASWAGGPRRGSIDSREIQPGDLFVGLRGEHVDGGAYAERALRAGAWGVLVAPEHARALVGGALVVAEQATPPAGGAVLAHPDPLAAMQWLARAWRQALGEEGAKVVAITGSTGKTSTKDILAALLGGAEARAEREMVAERGMRGGGECPPASVGGECPPASVATGMLSETGMLAPPASAGGPTVASPANLNTEIGLPLAILAAPRGTRVLVLEMAMRGRGQIAELVAIAEPEVGVIVNVGPVHLEQLGSLEGVAAAKAELIEGMAPGTTVVVPAAEPLLARHLRSDLRTVTFGEGGEVEFVERGADRTSIGGEVVIVDRMPGPQPVLGRACMPDGERASSGSAPPGAAQELIRLRPSFTQSHNLRNLLAAVAAARALGVTPAGRLEVEFSALRGERIAVGDGIVLINDCYNANPMSMRAALDDLAATAPGRRAAVLGDMLELGPEEWRLHREIGEYARARGVELLVAVGPLAGEMGKGLEGEVHRVPDAATAAELLPGLLRAGDTVLVKGSRGVGLERVAQALGLGGGR